MSNEHGEWRLATTPSGVLVGKFWLAWNADAVAHWAREVREIARRELIGQPWATLSDMTELEGVVPEGEPIIAELDRWRMKNGCRCIVHVMGDQWLTNIQRNQIEEIPDPVTGILHHRTNSLLEATAWLTEQGFPITLQQAQIQRPVSPMADLQEIGDNPA